ncbi:F-box domain containing protein [Tanacetum coccineum]
MAKKVIDTTGRISELLDFLVHHFLDFASKKDVSAHMFELMTYSEPPEVDIIEKCLESVLNKGVKVLDIDLLNHQDQSATSFTVSNCKLPSSLMVGVVKFNSLKLLSLCKVTIDEEVIKRLTASCPILKILELSRCFGLKRFCVSGLQNLKYVCFYYNHGVERIDIDVPNLRECGIYVQGVPCINLGSCKQLKSLTYHSWVFFPDFIQPPRPQKLEFEDSQSIHPEVV